MGYPTDQDFEAARRNRSRPGERLHVPAKFDARRDEMHEYAFKTRHPVPAIVVLCGSTKFKDAFARENFRLTLEGKIVLSIGCDAKSDEGLGITPEMKVKLDELHKRKIDLASEVFVLNVGGYVGDSTRSEIRYAMENRKPISYLEPDKLPEVDV